MLVFVSGLDVVYKTIFGKDIHARRFELDQLPQYHSSINQLLVQIT
jgi:hypothetical protein